MKHTHFAIVNEDPGVSRDDFADWVEAAQVQRTHVAAAYGRVPLEVKAYATRGDVPPDGGLVVFSKTMDVDGAIAYHTEVGDQLLALVCADLARSNGQSPSVALTHELNEAELNPCVNKSALASTGDIVDFEISDPCQDKTYPVTLLSGKVVDVADFVLGAWFDPEDDAGPYTWRDELLNLALSDASIQAPFTKTVGGYFQFVDPTGQRQQLGEKSKTRHEYSPRKAGAEKHHVARLQARQHAALAVAQALGEELGALGVGGRASSLEQANRSSDALDKQISEHLEKHGSVTLTATPDGIHVGYTPTGASLGFEPNDDVDAQLTKMVIGDFEPGAHPAPCPTCGHEPGHADGVCPSQ